MKIRYYCCLLILFSACATKRSAEQQEILSSLQIIDKNGFTETVSAKNRLETFKHVDFLEPQPYKKVMRVFGRNGTGQIVKITSYHPNGYPWQYLECLNGRAYGAYKEWHPNGRLKLEASVIEGLSDIVERAQVSWVFDNKSSAYDQDGNLAAEIFYEKGVLQGSSLYYHPNGQLEKSVPYHQDKIHGELLAYNLQGELIEKISYRNDLREGTAEGFWSPGQLKYQEIYENDLLITGIYISFKGVVVSEIIKGEGKQAIFEGERLYSLCSHENGVAKGKVELFDKEEELRCVYHIEEGKKQGEEWEYYPKSREPKLYLYWNNDLIQGMAKTWYPNGVLQSEREIHANRKHGLSFAWYEEGQLMLVEEYENDLLIKGSYFKKGDKIPVSKIEEGNGIVTLFDSKGHFIKKIRYEKGSPLID